MLVPKLRQLLNSFLKLDGLSYLASWYQRRYRPISYFYIIYYIYIYILFHVICSCIPLMKVLILVDIEWYYCIQAVLGQYCYCFQPQYFGGVLGLGWSFLITMPTQSSSSFSSTSWRFDVPYFLCGMYFILYIYFLTNC